MHPSTPAQAAAGSATVYVHADLALGQEQGQSAHTMAMCTGPWRPAECIYGLL